MSLRCAMDGSARSFGSVAGLYRIQEKNDSRPARPSRDFMPTCRIPSRGRTPPWRSASSITPSRPQFPLGSGSSRNHGAPDASPDITRPGPQSATVSPHTRQAAPRVFIYQLFRCDPIAFLHSHDSRALRHHVRGRSAGLFAVPPPPLPGDGLLLVYPGGGALWPAGGGGDQRAGLGARWRSGSERSRRVLQHPGEGLGGVPSGLATLSMEHSDRLPDRAERRGGDLVSPVLPDPAGPVEAWSGRIRL